MVVCINEPDRVRFIFGTLLSLFSEMKFFEHDELLISSIAKDALLLLIISLLNLT